MTIRHKLWLLLFIPLLTIAFLGGRALLESRRVASEAATVQQLSTLAVHLSAVVHETQKERGLTAGYLGSEGKAFTRELEGQREQTDRRIGELRNLLASLERAHFPRGFNDALDAGLSGLASIEGKRTAVTAMNLSAADAIAYYTEVNSALLDTIGGMGTVSSNAELTIRTAAYVSFLKAKERAGIERAVLSNTFVRDGFAAGMFSMFVSLVTAQDMYTREFRLASSPADVAFYDKTMQAPCVPEVARYREIATKKATEGGFGQDAQVWFATITAKINLLKEVEDHLSEGLRHRTGEIRSAATARLTYLSMVVVGIIVGVVVFGWLVLRSILRPIQAAAAMLEDIAQGEGDLTRRLDDRNRDELDELAKWFNTFVAKLQGMIRDIAKNAQSLASSSTNLTTTAAQLASGAEQTTAQSGSVASAAEEMNTNMSGMATSTQQVSMNVNTVAAAVEQMSASIGEVARNAEKAATVAANAAELTERSNASVSELGAAAEEIGKVTVLIQDIAEQTNLLALNATIEAARAGDAGKGFAVVATEVKELAKQTGSAIDDIRQRVEGIQGSTDETVRAIGEISNVISDVNAVSRTIASAVEQQSITTKEIAENVAQTTTAAETVSQSITESATACQEIAENIVGVDQAAKQTAEGAVRTQTDGQELAHVAAQIRLSVGQFRIDADQAGAMRPVELPASVPDAIRASFARVKDRGAFDAFYTRFLDIDPQIAPRFAATDFAKQKQLLQDGVALALTFAAGDGPSRERIDALATSHSRERLSIHPDLYPLWLKAWIDSLADLDPQWNTELEALWRNQLQPALDTMASKYES